MGIWDAGGYGDSISTPLGRHHARDAGMLAEPGPREISRGWLCFREPGERRIVGIRRHALGGRHALWYGSRFTMVPAR